MQCTITDSNTTQAQELPEPNRNITPNLSTESRIPQEQMENQPEAGHLGATDDNTPFQVSTGSDGTGTTFKKSQKPIPPYPITPGKICKRSTYKLMRVIRYYTRVSRNPYLVNKYGKMLKAGKEVPKVIVYVIEGGTQFVTSGVDVIGGAMQIHRKMIDVEIRHGSQTDAYKEILAANKSNSPRFTDDEKSITAYRAMKVYSDRSNNEIAELCGVELSFIEEERKEYQKYSSITSVNIESNTDNSQGHSPQASKSPEQTLPIHDSEGNASSGESPSADLSDNSVTPIPADKECAVDTDAQEPGSRLTGEVACTRPTQSTNQSDVDTVPIPNVFIINHDTHIIEIKKLHDQNLSHAQSAFENAVRIGELLTNMKSTFKHGEWLPCIKNNFPFDERTARRYMQVFNKRDRLCKSDTVSDLTLSGAYASLKIPRGSRKATEQDQKPAIATEVEVTSKLTASAIPDETKEPALELQDATQSSPVNINVDDVSELPIDTTAIVTPIPGETGTAGTSDEGDSSSTDVSVLTPDAINPGTDQNQACGSDGGTVSPLEADSKASLTDQPEEIKPPSDVKTLAHGNEPQAADKDIAQRPSLIATDAGIVEQEKSEADIKFKDITNPEVKLPQSAPVVEAEQCQDEVTPFLLADGSELPPTSLAVGWISHEEMLSTTALLTTTNKTKSKIEMDAGTFLQRLQIEIASLLNRVLGVNPSYSDLHNADDALTTIRRKITAHSNYHRKPTK